MSRLQNQNGIHRDRHVWKAERDIILAPTGLQVILGDNEKMRIIAFDGRTGAALVMGPDGYLQSAPEMAHFEKSKDIYYDVDVVTTADGFVKVAEELHSIAEALHSIASCIPE